MSIHNIRFFCFFFVEYSEKHFSRFLSSNVNYEISPYNMGNEESFGY